MENSKERAVSYDFVLLIPTLLLMAFGLVAVYSASSSVAELKMGDSYYYLKRQGMFCLVGICLLICTKNLPISLYQKIVYPLLGISFCLVALCLVPGIGTKIGGASRWLRFGGISFQPSELAKLSLALFVAYSIAKKGPDMNSFSRGLVPHLAIAGAFMILFLLQPDLGTTIIIGSWLLIILFVGGVNVAHLAGLGLLSIPCLIWLVAKADYRLKRWLAFLNPWDDPQGLGFQIIHSFLAFGSGGLTGAGLGAGKQKLFYLPEPHTDFILPIVGEELGLVGVASIILLFGVLIGRGIQISLDAPDLHSSYLSLGIISFLGLQVIINMGVAVGLLPTKGLTLPFISYGGSSLVMTMMGIGILCNVSGRR